MDGAMEEGTKGGKEVKPAWDFKTLTHLCHSGALIGLKGYYL